MNFGQMQTEVRRKLNESSATFWTDDDIKEALNDGYEEISDETEWYEREATIETMAARLYHDLRTVLSDTFLSLRRVFNTTTNRWCYPTTHREMDRTYSQWELTTGENMRVTMRGLWWLAQWPKRPGDSGRTRVIYTGMPPAMSASTDTPGFPKEFHKGIVEYALSDLKAQERESKKSIAHWAEYKVYEGALKRWVNGRQSLARLEVL
jgi:hypothetical protein